MEWQHTKLPSHPYIDRKVAVKVLKLQFSFSPWTVLHMIYTHDISTGTAFEGSNEVGVFSLLTNKYAIVCQGGSENFYGGEYNCNVKCHFSTIVMICMRQFEDMCHNSMH